MARLPVSDKKMRAGWGPINEPALETLIAMAAAVVANPGAVPAGFVVV